MTAALAEVDPDLAAVLPECPPDPTLAAVLSEASPAPLPCSPAAAVAPAPSPEPAVPTLVADLLAALGELDLLPEVPPDVPELLRLLPHADLYVH